MNRAETVIKGNTFNGKVYHRQPGLCLTEQIKVSMLFCDIVNSTRLSIDLSPLQLRELMLDYYSITSKTVTSLGGYVVGYRGDGVLAVFGKDSYSFCQSITLNAVSAAINVIDSIKQERLSEIQPVGLNVRIAIATGYVVASPHSGSDSINSEFFGHTPYLAARLQTVAPSNAVVCSADTRSLINSSFQTNFIGWRSLKGFRQKTPVWEIAPITRQSNEEGKRYAK